MPSASKKRGQFFRKQIDFHTELSDGRWKIIIEKFGRNNTALTFALPFQKRVAGNGQKIFESLETIALTSRLVRE